MASATTPPVGPSRLRSSLARGFVRYALWPLYFAVVMLVMICADQTSQHDTL
jgi:hypothetical protein